VSSVSDSSGTPVSLGPPPDNRGESVEGAFADGLWGVFQNQVAAVASTNVPETANGDILATSAGPWLGSSAARDRFLSMIWRPLGDLAAHSSPTTTLMIDHMSTRNPTTWHQLQPELLTFNMAMIPPTATFLFPDWGPLAGGAAIGLDVSISGSNFIARTTGTVGTSGRALETQVTFGGAAATAMTVNAQDLLTATPPPRSTAGTVEVRVTTPAGVVRMISAFTYIDEPLLLLDVVPARVSALGGDIINLTGTGFLPGAIVFIDSLPLDPAVVQIASPGQITAETQANGPGLATVVVQNPDGTFTTWPGTLEFV
jgi:hypothetical protein